MTKPSKPDTPSAEFHAVEGSRGFLLMPKQGFPLTAELDDFLAYVVREFPLRDGPDRLEVKVSRPEDIAGYRDALGMAHRRLYAFLVEYGFRVPDEVSRAAARLDEIEIPREFYHPFLVPTVLERWEATLAALETELEQLLELLARYEPPRSKQVFADAAVRAQLNAHVLEFLEQVVEFEDNGNLLSLVPRVEWPADLAARGDAWQARHPSQPVLELAPPTSIWC